MQGNARGMQVNTGEYREMSGTYGSGYKVPAECWGMLGNASICQGNVQEWVQSARGIQVNAGECRGMPGERMVVGAKSQGNTGEYQGNLWEWVQSVMGKLGNTGECQGNE